MSNSIYEVDCAGTQLKVYDDCVSFAPKGALGFFTKGIAGERKLFYKDISSIQFKESSKLLSGFIEFYLKGHYNAKQGGGLFAGTTNDNRFTFHNKHLNTMLEIKEFIQDKLNEGPSNKAENTDIASELRKYKQLLDDEIITQAEFEAKKRQLLDLD